MKIAPLIFILMFSSAAYAQETETREQLWMGYFNQAKFSKHWGSWLDVQMRTTDEFIHRPSQCLFRPGITYCTSNQVKLTLGYAYLYNFTNSYTYKPSFENRIWQQIIFTQKAGKSKIIFRFRSEQRFRQHQEYINRFRLFTGWQFPLAKATVARKYFGVLSNEIHFQSGKKHSFVFDQNRFTAGIGYSLNEKCNLQLAYMQMFAISSGRQIFTHCIRISFYHTLDFSSKEQ